MPLFSSNGLPNLGGPGWIANPLSAVLVLDGGTAERSVDQRGRAASTEVKGFDREGVLSGKLVIGAPAGREVRHLGVEIVLYSRAFAIGETRHEVNVVEKRWVLLEPGSLSSAVEVPFELDLSKLSDLRDSYASPHMQLRHVLGYEIRRPWYTFPITGELEFHLKDHSPPALPHEAGATNTVLEVGDFGGRCVFDHGDSVYRVGGTISGTVRLTEMGAGSPVEEVALLVGRTDFCGGMAEDTVLRRLVVHSAADGPIASDVDLPVRLSLADQATEGAGGAGAALDAAPALVTPSVPRLAVRQAAGDEFAVEVRHWVRLLLRGPGSSAWWSTHPITLVRAHELRDVKAGAAATGV